jgi:hypothetical protein
MEELMKKARFRMEKAAGEHSEHHLEDSEIYEYEAIDEKIHLMTWSAESVVLTKKDLEDMLKLIGGE